MDCYHKGKPPVQLPSAVPVSKSPPADIRVSAEPTKAPWRFVLPVLGLYAVFVAIGALTHEMWRDELAPLGIVRASHTFGELLENTSRAQTPMLWYLTLWPLKYLQSQPEGMQLIHACLAIGAVFVFLRYARFTNLQKVLFVLGYFLIYEYSVICRNYAEFVLLAFCVCALWPQRARRLLLISGLLFLLIHTSLLGLMMALSFSMILFLEYVTHREFRAVAGKVRPLIGGFAVLVSAVLCIYTIKIACPPDTWAGKTWTQGFDPERIAIALQMVGRAFAPIPYMFLWNTNYLANVYPTFYLTLSVAILIVTLLLCRRWLAMVLYGSMVLQMFILGYFLYTGELRHQGHIYIAFFCALWIAAYYSPRKPRWEFAPYFWPSRPSRGLFGRILHSLEVTKVYLLKAENLIRNPVVYGLLLLQMALGFGGSVIDWEIPFSQSRAVAQYIQEKGMADKLILAEPDFGGEPVAIWLDREVYFFRGDRMGTFLKMDLRRFGGKLLMGREAPLDMEKVREKLNSQRDSLLLTLFPVQEGPNLTLLARFTGGITDEQYFLYSVHNP